MKKPWLAALLNFILPGVGYLYIESKSVFGWLILASTVLGFIAGFDPTLGELVMDLFTRPLFLLSAGTICIAFVVDAYQRAQQFNAVHQKASKKE